MKTIIRIILIIQFFFILNLVANAEKTLFCYKFRPGEYLTYATNRQDSVVLNDRYRSTTRELSIRIRETLEVKESSLDVHHALTYHLDSLSVSPERLSALVSDWSLYQNIQQQFAEPLIQMSTNGYPLKDKRHFRFNQLTLPLSEFPLERYEEWEFKFEIPIHPNSLNSCRVVVFGKGMLYDFIREDNRTLARFVVNTTQLFKGECQGMLPDKIISREGEIMTTHLVTFDEDLGIITKIITDQVTREERQSDSGPRSLIIKSKSTTELVDWDMARGVRIE